MGTGSPAPFSPFSVSSSHLLQVQTTQFLQNFNISPPHSKILNKLLMFQEMSFPMKDTSQQLNSWNPLTANQPGLGVSVWWATQLESVYSLAEQMSSPPGSCERMARDCTEVSVRLSFMGKKSINTNMLQYGSAWLKDKCMNAFHFSMFQNIIYALCIFNKNYYKRCILIDF